MAGMTAFTFATAGRVVFGPGVADRVPALAAERGDSVLVFLGGHTEPAATPGLSGLPAETRWHHWSGEPTLAGVEQALALVREVAPDVVVAWGGGSVIDLAKAAGVLAAGTGAVLDHLEVVGGGASVPATSVPVIAVPTTAGTGAEVTANAPVLVPEHRVKVSLRGPAMLPAVAVVDPALTVSAPPAVTAATGLDALSQNLEALTSRRATALTDLLAGEGLARSARSLRRAFEHGGDLDARTDLSLAALLSGMALANGGLGAVHGLAAPLGGMLGAPHGELCAAVLAATVEANVAALASRAPGSAALARYADAARILTGDPSATPSDAAAWLRETTAALDVRGLDALGLGRAEHGAAADAALRASSMRGNPVDLTRDEVMSVLARSTLG